ncbi:hypothetical protein EVAR_44966_1 [Eumeta japonica]|uniref:Uncharacterized protein n=1 Tax=Eumeta variegata TaxID=151549 RepID=A0A4C1W358_EUMVA|nr:hypothetical protein EVAR_44966_1 [Eumeta japonica]
MGTAIDEPAVAGRPPLKCARGCWARTKKPSERRGIDRDAGKPSPAGFVRRRYTRRAVNFNLARRRGRRCAG